MIVLLSPAKTLDFESAEYDFHTKPRLLKDSGELVGILKSKRSSDLQKLMKVSEKIADLNVERFNQFSTPFNKKNAKPSVLAFKGDVYTGLQAEDFDKEELKFAQEHIRILSGLYGVLRPMDLMQPYRLEMGTKLSTERGKNLYDFWDDRITKLLNKDLKNVKGDVVINLASKEYFNSVKTENLKGELYHINFKENRNGVYKIISFSAKKARGIMARYIIKNKTTSPDKLKKFNEDGYSFNKELSKDKDWVFTR